MTRNGQKRVRHSAPLVCRSAERFIHGDGAATAFLNQPGRRSVSPDMKHPALDCDKEGDDPVNKAATAALAMLALYSLSTSAHAAKFDFLGTWTVTTSEPAPWADAKEKPVASDLKALIGHSVSFQADRIDAPEPLKCRKPRYEIKQYTPDMLFQGSLTDPKPRAAALGFAGNTIPTVETGCEGAFDFHFLNADNAMFGLNNRIYRIQRSKP
jgi:hypothetical protein